MSEAIPASEWRWFGRAAHFICGHWCRFHLATQIGDFLVSTVGNYIHPRNSGGGEQAESKFLREHGYEEIGYQRKFETMVFRVTGICSSAECDCGGMPLIDGYELDFAPYNDAAAATSGHMAMCAKVARGNVKHEEEAS